MIVADTSAIVAIAFAGLVAMWLADLVCRVVCARTGVYLLLRRAIDGAPVDSLRTGPQQRGPEDAAAAGFIEVNRVGDD